jgi:hypothetical protein
MRKGTGMYYKILDDLKSMHGGTYTWTPGEWTPIVDNLVACESGYHACRRSDLIEWLGPQIWECEINTIDMVEEEDKVVVRSIKLIRKLDTWNERTARLFAADCAEHVLPIFEKRSDSTASREAIQAARDFADNKISKGQLAAARDAARAAERQWQTEKLFQYLDGMILPRLPL